MAQRRLTVSVERSWICPVIVAATGPSLTKEVAWACRRARWFDGWRIVAVNDAHRLLPLADALYACDERWWDAYAGVMDFPGEKWTTHEDGPEHTNCKESIAEKYGLRCVRGRGGDTFSTDQEVIHYGSNSGFQAVNLALLKGATRVVLVGFDMRLVGDKRHFFGDHPEPLHNRADYRDFIKPFQRAAQNCRVPIVNCTPGSALDAFPMAELEKELIRRD